MNRIFWLKLKLGRKNLSITFIFDDKIIKTQNGLKKGREIFLGAELNPLCDGKGEAGTILERSRVCSGLSGNLNTEGKG